MIERDGAGRPQRLYVAAERPAKAKGRRPARVVAQAVIEGLAPLPGWQAAAAGKGEGE